LFIGVGYIYLCVGQDLVFGVSDPGMDNLPTTILLEKKYI